MRVSAITRCGTESAASQDRVLVNKRVLCDEEFSGEFRQHCTVGIADGVGGNPGGDIAAEFVCGRLSALSKFTPEDARRVNAELLEYAGAVPGMESMATTFSGVFPGGELLHVGNTRIFAVRGGYLKQLTADMTARSCLLTLDCSEEAENFSHCELTACFGGGRESFYSPVIFEAEKEGTLLLTSDGIHDCVSAEELEGILAGGGTDPDILRRVVSRALEHGSEDDMSAVLVRF